MMLRRLSYGLLVLLLALVSCTGSLEEKGGPYIELSLFCEDPVVTRAGQDGTKDGVDRYNENWLQTVDFFFYPGDSLTVDHTLDATYHVHLESGKRGSDVFRLELNSEIINQRIFPTRPVDIHKTTVLAVVNYHGTLVANEETLAGTSLDELEAILVTSDFVSPADHAQEDFLMSGRTVINLRGRTSIMTATGSIDLQRYACKLTTNVKVANVVTLSNGEMWTPMLEGMEIYLENGVKTVALSGEDPEPVYFSYSKNRKRFVDKDAQGNYSPIVGTENGYYQTYPMYMYPQHWTYGSNEGYDREPYLKLVVPWSRLEENGFGATQKQLYYKIIMPDDTRTAFRRRFARNNWYHLNIDVGILGAETDEAAVTIDASCYIVDWQGSGIQRNAMIGSARYLSVERDSVELNNINTVELTYNTSHPVIIKPGTITVTRPYYGTQNAGAQTLSGVVRVAQNDDLYPKGTKYLEYDESHRKAMNNGEDWFYNTGTSIVYEHVLQNDFRLTSFEYSPYTISFSIVHEDRPNDPVYTRDLYIKQYPAIYIEATRNSDNTFVYVGHDVLGNKDNYNKQIHTSDHWGYVYVDNEQIVRPDIRNTVIDETYMAGWRAQGFDYPNAEEYHWRIVWYTGGTLDLFKMNVTVLPPNSDFVIGDPRTQTINNLRNSDDDPDNDFHNAPAIYDGETERSLKYYYPAEGSDRTVNMMAPSYRLTSKCNGIEFGDLTFEQAQLRCAVYQEDGFPAGRWRLPTRGEIHFIAMLSANNAFERLFTIGSSYWSANGCVKVQSGSVTFVNVQKALTRCVYDSWYWGDEQWPDREQFIWGDKPR